MSSLFLRSSGCFPSMVHSGADVVKSMFSISVGLLSARLLFLVVLVLFCSRNESGMYGKSMLRLPLNRTRILLFLGTCEYCIPGKHAV